MPNEIPTDHELRLARARKQDRENNAHLGEIELLFKAEFQRISPLDHVYLGGSSGGVGAVIFFRKESDVAECEANGISEKMRGFITEKLKEFGHGNRYIHIEFDSFENVEKHYEGNYFLRLR